MEVLENGCIPIVKKFVFIDYFKFVFGDHPFILVNKWEDAEKIINNYLSNPEKLKNKQLEIENWYKIFKDKLSGDIKGIIEDENLNLISQQKIYQKKGHLNLLVLFNYYYYFILRKKSYFIKISKTIYKAKEKIKEKIK